MTTTDKPRTDQLPDEVKSDKWTIITFAKGGHSHIICGPGVSKEKAVSRIHEVEEHIKTRLAHGKGWIGIDCGGCNATIMRCDQYSHSIPFPLKA